MTEPIFFKPSSVLSVRDILALTEARPQSATSLDRRISRIAALDLAGPDDLTFIDQEKLVSDLRSTEAGVCLTSEEFVTLVPPHVTALVVRNPYVAFVKVAAAMFPDALRSSTLFEVGDVTTGATLHPTVRIEDGVKIDPGVIVGPGAEIGTGTAISAGAAIAAGVRIGRHCSIGAGVTIANALLGDSVVVHAGCRIGQEAMVDADSTRRQAKIPQLGRVIIQDGVEIGANSTIDRGNLRDTMIGEETKIDNLVQIGQNVRIGRHCFLGSLTGVMRAVTIEDFAVIGVQVGIASDVKIGSHAVIAAQSAVVTDVPAGQRLGRMTNPTL